MSRLFDTVQPAVKKETKNVAVSTGIGVVLMWILFAVLHVAFPVKVPFDYTVIIRGIGGGIIAVLNFFLMGLTVQKVAATEDDADAKMKMKASYSRRMLMQVLWIIIAITAPCFWFVAGILPLLFPGMGIKIRGIFLKPEKQQK